MNEHEPVDTHETILQETARFKVVVTEYDGRPTVTKTMQQEKVRQNFENELAAYETYAEIASEPNAPFRIAEVLAQTDDSATFSFLDGRPMEEIVTVENSDEYYRMLAEIMAFCDSSNERHQRGGGRQTAQEVEKSKLHAQTYLAEFDKASSRGFVIDTDLVSDVARIYFQGVADLETSFVNGDLTPSHVMVSEDEKPALFDFENASANTPRFMDAINWGTKIWMQHGDESRGRAFIEMFCDKAQIDIGEHSEQIATLVAIRCIGFFNELATEPNEIHNTSTELSQELTDNIMSLMAWAKQLSMLK